MRGRGAGEGVLEVGEFETVMQTRDVQSRILSTSKCLDEVMETRKKCSFAFIEDFSKIRANLKRHNRVYIL